LIEGLNQSAPGDSEWPLALPAPNRESGAVLQDVNLHERWRAVDADRNIARDYELLVSTDLFGWTLVERRWGRIGASGQSRCTSFAERDVAARLVASIRGRRGSALRRIGTEYRRIQV
jgi:predicted DNA-binding WGR domain protein